jgi:hypothetical protein
MAVRGTAERAAWRANSVIDKNDAGLDSFEFRVSAGARFGLAAGIHAGVVSTEMRGDLRAHV